MNDILVISLVSTIENVENFLHYSGELWEETTGLQYLRSRWYDPSLGRFLNEDSFEGELDNPLSLNQYTYLEQNPLIYKDPTGRAKDTPANSMGGGFQLGVGVTWASPMKDIVKQVGKIAVKTTKSSIDKAKAIPKTKAHKIPEKGEKPNSQIHRLDKNGNLVLRRYYDKNGYAKKDIDFTAHGNTKTHPKVPNQQNGIGVRPIRDNKCENFGGK